MRLEFIIILLGRVVVRSYMAGLLGNIHFKLHSNVYMNTWHDCRVAHLDTSLTLIQISTDSIHVLEVNQGWLCENTSDLFHNISPCLFQLDLFPIEFTCCGIFIRR